MFPIKLTLNSIFYKLYLTAISLICVGYISILPPFEGFDEFAHLSSILEISTGKLPVYGKSSIDTRLYEYVGPKPYQSGLAPFDSEGFGYKNFFSDVNRASLYVVTHIPGSPIVGYQPANPSIALNWEAQHPPLYYILMSWTPDFFKNATFLQSIFFMRFISVSLFLIAVYVVIKNLKIDSLSCNQNSVKIGMLLYPMLFPMVFFDIGRIGNDSLCCLIAAFIAFLVRKLFDNWRLSNASYLGVALGFGLLTKALFLPIAFAVLLFLLFSKNSKVNLSQRISVILTIFVTMLAIGSWWYIKNYFAFGSLTGADEFIVLESKGGMLVNLESRFSVYEFARGLVVPLVSYIWAGSSSLVRMPLYFIAPLLLINLIIFLSYIKRLKKTGMLLTANSLFLWIFSFFYLSLIVHMMHVLALYGRATTPGWYLNILFPWAIPAIIFTIDPILRNFHYSKFLFKIIYIFLIIFQTISIYFLSTLYSGCSGKGANKIFEFPNNYLCLDNLSQTYERMNLLGFPLLGLASFIIGFSTLFILYLKTLSESYDVKRNCSLL